MSRQPIFPTTRKFLNAEAYPSKSKPRMSLRLSSEEMDMLDYCAEKHGISRTQMIAKLARDERERLRPNDPIR